MRKLILLLLTLTLIVGVLASCDNNETTDKEMSSESTSVDTSVDTSANTSTDTSADTSVATSNETTTAANNTETASTNVVMRAKIIELDSQTALVEPVEGDPARNSSDRIYVSVGNFEDIGAKVGSIVDITYDGYIMETYPAQIRAQEWSKVSDPAK